MVEHLVLFKLRSDVPAEVAAAMVDALRGLRDKVPGILDLTCGANLSERSQGYTHGLAVRFTDRAALDAYGPHPAHQAVVQAHVRPNTEAVLVVDYEMVPAGEDQ